MMMTMSASNSDCQRVGKRGRDCDENSHENETMVDAHTSVGVAKRQRYHEHTPSSAPELLCSMVVNKRIAEICAHYDSRIKELMDDRNTEVASKDALISQLREECSRVTQEGMRVSSSIAEENRILKKGVCIQENKLRETTAQNEQLRNGLHQAVDRITQLEKDNAMLRGVIYGGGSGGMGSSQFPPGPPDVF